MILGMKVEVNAFGLHRRTQQALKEHLEEVPQSAGKMSKCALPLQKPTNHQSSSGSNSCITSQVTQTIYCELNAFMAVLPIFFRPLHLEFTELYSALIRGALLRKQTLSLGKCWLAFGL